MIANLFANVNKQTVKYDTYFDAYDEVFSKFYKKDIVFVEIGVLGGGSLTAFRNYFGPNSRIIGIDLNPEMKETLEKEGFEIYLGDQSDPSFWSDFFQKVGNVDIILDDGGHTYKQQIITTISVLPNINDGGLLVVEDTHTSYMKRFGFPSKYTFLEFSKFIVDKINNKFFSSESDIASSIYQRNLFSIQFFESIVVMHKNAKLCRLPQKVVNGVVNESIVDFRVESERSKDSFLVKFIKSFKFIVPLSTRKKLNEIISGRKYIYENRSLKRFFK
jgi:hypothetical protein